MLCVKGQHVLRASRQRDEESGHHFTAPCVFAKGKQLTLEWTYQDVRSRLMKVDRGIGTNPTSSCRDNSALEHCILGALYPCSKLSMQVLILTQVCDPNSINMTLDKSDIR
jgi:hypothetical protein